MAREQQGNQKKNNLRIPPQNLDAEKALLGSIMLKPEVITDISDTVFPKFFYFDKHRVIYEAMFKLFSKREPIDLLSVTTKLKESKKLDSIGGASYLTELTNFVPSASNASHYAKIVQKKYIIISLGNMRL